MQTSTSHHPSVTPLDAPRKLPLLVGIALLFSVLSACVPSDSEGPSAEPAFAVSTSRDTLDITLADDPVSAALGVTLERDAEPGDAIDVSVANPPDGITIAPITVPAGETAGTLTVVVSPDAQQGSSTLAVEATDGTATDTTSVQVFVRGAAGSSNTTFGTDGHVVHDAATSGSTADQVAVQPDGRIVMATLLYGDDGNDLKVSRFHGDGSLDETFGVDGSTVHASEDLLYVRDILHHEDHTYILYKDYVDDGGTNRLMPRVVRFDPDGVVDETFGIDGVARIDVADRHNFHSLAVDASDRILVGGSATVVVENRFTVTRLNTDGSLDTSFGDAGAAMHFVGLTNAGYDMVVLPDGDVVLAGGVKFGTSTDDYDFAAVRFDADGAVATGFGDAGVATHDFAGEDDYAHAIVLQGDKLVLGGGREGVSAHLASMLRLNLDGSLDTTFGIDGKIQFDSGAGRDNIRRLAVQSDGKLVAAGESWDDENKRILIFRTTADGHLDVGPDADPLTADGYVRATVDGAMWPTFSDMILLPDDSILTSGTLYDTDAATYAGGFLMKHWR